MGGPSGPDWRPSATITTLRRRAELIERTRAFFRARGVLEVDVPCLQGGANLDHGVTPYRVEAEDGPRWLPTSPEHPLKRLVCAGAGAVWSLSPAFRRGERGARHQSEFRMLEWYRPGWDDVALRDEVVALLADLTGRGTACAVLPWREAFRRHADLDPFTADDAAIVRALGADAGVPRDRAEALDLLLTARVEPRLGRGAWTAITDYPPWAAAQARLRTDATGQPVAARFEIYGDGVELCNGYHELADAGELGARLQAELDARAPGSAARDARFEAAIAHGLGDCAGVAVGFDRVVMLALGLGSLAETMAFASDRA